MSGAYGGGTRDRDTIERELRVLASVRNAYRERGGAMPSIDQMDALLDELIELTGRGKHRLERGDSDARPSLWR
ncbi:hypothetical protein [Mycobacterium sp.]|jgi:hypothetical protein|uniref:hypothetical protein n=1 Tax=Mycobacterium sp. TaxID=1785 RepID=UPI003BAFFC34